MNRTEVRHANAPIHRRSDRYWIGLIVWILFWGVARALLEEVNGTVWIRIAIALLPALPFAFFLYLFVQMIRSLDELERRIHLEALAIAFPFAILLLMILGLLELAITLSPHDWSYRHVWAIVVSIYFVSLAITRTRYA